jgi:hypothetical protein
MIGVGASPSMSLAVVVVTATYWINHKQAGAHDASSMSPSSQSDSRDPRSPAESVGTSGWHEFAVEAAPEADGRAGLLRGYYAAGLLEG